MLKQRIDDLKGLFRGLRAVKNTGALEGFKLSDAIIMLRNAKKYSGTVTGSMESSAARFPDRLALVDDDGELTYSQLRDHARKTAAALASHGVNENSRVGMMARNGRGVMVPLLAKGYLGYMALLLNVGASGKQLADIIREHKLDVLFIDSEFDERIPQDRSNLLVVHAHAAPDHRTDINFPTIEDLWANYGPHSTSFPDRPKQGGVVLFSSGTNGIPRAVLCPESRNWFGVYGCASSAYQLKKLPVVQLTGGIFHTIGWGALFAAMLASATVVTMRVFNPVRVLEQVDKYKCIGIQSSAMFLRDMLAADDGSYDTSHLTFISNSGNAMSEDLVRGLQAKYGNIIVNCYGSTELFLVSIATREDLVEDPLTAGRAVWNGRLAIIDRETGKELPPGQEGVIHARTNFSMVRYLGTRNKEVVRQGLIDMGDRGVIDPVSGRLRVLGRNSDMIIVGGENIYPSTVADIIDKMPGVKESYCVGVEDEKSFQRIKAYVVTDGTITEDQIRDHVRRTYIQWAIPRDVVLLTQPLPRNATGKIVKDLVLEMDHSADAAAEQAPVASAESAPGSKSASA